MSIVPIKAFAAARSRSGTIDGVRAVTAGKYGAVNVLFTKVSAITAMTAVVDVDMATTAITHMIPTRIRSAAIMTLRLSYRSAIAPPSGSNKTYGLSRTTAATPTHAADPVASRM